MTIHHYELCGADEKHVFSPHCWKTRMALAHKGLDFETVAVPFTKVATVENGEGRRVPVLRDGDTVIEESYEIAKYLDRAYPDKPSLFNGEGGEELTKFVISWSLTQLHPAVAKLAVYDIHNALAPEDQAFFRQTREKLFGCTLEEFDAKFPKNGEALATALVPMENLLGRQKFLGGDSPVFADYVVFGALQWLRTTCSQDHLPQEGAVADWFNRLLDMYDGMGRAVKAPA
ncbi:MAG: glutathione S-transferase family protein [Rhizobiaceae bacterium]|nr:glutathione S-transferase family protein [Hyphomicrobiales bacterium]NRB31564.1 glutathione S-transferase family protein [Rhizobiaceae bacterium]